MSYRSDMRNIIRKTISRPLAIAFLPVILMLGPCSGPSGSVSVQWRLYNPQGTRICTSSRLDVGKANWAVPCAPHTSQTTFYRDGECVMGTKAYLRSNNSYPC